MADIAERQRVVALAHPGYRAGDVERGPVRHRGLEADQRSGLVVSDHGLLPGVADAAIVVSQHRAAAPGQIAGKAPVDLARHGGRRIDQHGMALRPAWQEQPCPQQISVRRRQADVVDEYVVQRSLCHRSFPRVRAIRPANANSAFAARACPTVRNSNWRSVLGLCINRRSAASDPATPFLVLFLRSFSEGG